MPDEPAVPRPAATVLLLRDAPDPVPGRTPLQVFLQRRVAGMAFAGGMTVFPGGGVDPADRPDPARWTGPDPAWWAGRLDCDEELAGAFVQAAVRETYEECGVLLAGPDTAAVPAGARADLVARRRTLADVLAAAGLHLRADLLAPWSRWVTPEESPRRYDTVFLAARVPDGQAADAHTTEAVEATWWHPAEALERWQRGELELMAPTVRTLQEIDEHADAGAVLAAAAQRRVRPRIPRVRREGERVVVVVGGDDGFEVAAGHLRPGDHR
ncbi:MAG TPA: NUDIX hydrolase [Pseudonocardia sp.]|jgi:8-oxo-dGTP pyrophosphatase MutT (NUDIX family)|nr:NUDIX hydrolase [Pseudonocardia sp.]